MRRILLLGAASLAAACGPPSVRSVSYADPEVACPGARTAWTLEITDQRADRSGADKAIAAIRDGIEKSFPGCKWTIGSGASGDVIAIEVHRFASQQDGDSWEAAAEWSVRARNAGGRTLTEFEANEEVSRPNYVRSDNEKESLSEAFRKALERTVKGLRSVPVVGAIRPRAGTPRREAANPAATFPIA
jgi:hypothetical protein